LRFAKALAGSGAAVLIPEIPEWRELHLAPVEAGATIRAAVLHLGRLEGVIPDHVGLMGFSMGVSHVLHSAIDPALSGRLGGIAGFGGFGDMERTIRFLFRGEHEWEGTTRELDPDPYGRWVVAGNYLPELEGYEDAADVAESLLELARAAGDLQVGAWDARYDSLKEDLLRGIHPSRQDLFRALAPDSGHRPPVGITEQIAPLLAQAAHSASPSAKPTSFLDQITVPVRLVHGRGDRLIPYTESLRLGQGFPADSNVKVYLTGLFSHSQTEKGGGMGAGEPGVEEQLNFVRILADILTLV
jgi:pimeloyl-ACP methyl ester carboxylesterase